MERNSTRTGEVVDRTANSTGIAKSELLGHRGRHGTTEKPKFEGGNDKSQTRKRNAPCALP